MSYFKSLTKPLYYGLFRISEITASPHAIRARDVHVGRNKPKLKFVLRSSKTHGRGTKPQIVKISNDASFTLKPKDGVCPFTILNEYFSVRSRCSPGSDKQFFVFSDRSLVSASAIRTVMNSCISRCGLNPKVNRTHSYRIGRAVDLLAMHVEIPVIMRLGRWKSSIVYEYLKY